MNSTAASFVSLGSGIYAVRIGLEAIVLDIRSDRYIALSAEATSLLESLLGKSLALNPATQQAYDALGQALPWSLVQNLLAQQIIVLSADQPKNIRHLAVAPSLGEGFLSIEWKIRESIFATPKEVVPKRLVWEALWTIWNARRVMKQHGIAGMQETIQRRAKPYQQLIVPSEAQIRPVLQAILHAMRWYPRQLVCLPIAFAFALLGQRRGWSLEFLIGVRKDPFYAHAWTEIDGKIVTDSPHIQGRIAPILRVSTWQDPSGMEK